MQEQHGGVLEDALERVLERKDLLIGLLLERVIVPAIIHEGNP